jgi:diguanylate cyclase (GGDEF)-like protein/PAS domain S-box-containing protein
MSDSYRRVAWGLLILFLALLFLGGLALWQQRYLDDLEETTHGEESEFRIITSVLTDAVRKKNYETIDALLKEWGSNIPSIVELRLVAENGFVFGQYQRQEPAEHKLEFKTNIEYSYNKKATLTKKDDVDFVYARRTRFGWQLLTGFALVSAVSGYLLLIGVRRRQEALILRDRTEDLHEANVQLQEEISRRKTLEQSLFEEKQLIETTLHSIGDAVITTNAHGLVTYLNPVAEQLTGWSEQEALDKPLTEIFPIINESTREPAGNPVSRCLAQGHVVSLSNNVSLVNRQGHEFAIEDSAAPIRLQDGRIVGAVMVFKDVSEKRRLVQQLSHQARHDSLTGLVNRSEFHRQLERFLDNVRSNGGEHALCYLDLDQFKVINDTCGHTAGDALLQQISLLLKEHARTGDIVARLGGDEFGLLLGNCPLSKAEEIARVMCRSIGEIRFPWEDKIFEVGASIGLVPITSASQDPKQLLSHADVACYAAKDHGRNRVHVYTMEDEELSRRERELHWASLISGALEQNRFRLYVQQVVCLDNSRTVPRNHYEVLLRMLDDDGSEISPGVFIPAAERYNLMPSVDEWVIRHTLAHLDKHRQQLDFKGISLAINLSGNSLNREGLQSYIEEQFARFNVPPQAICFEITETAVIHNLAQASEFIHALKKLGCQFALDDFGSGLSSFAYLKNLPVDYLKIDGSFVRDMVNNRINDAMVSAINSIGHVMGILTIAEFVENKAILARLRELGVDYAQGYGVAMLEPIEHIQSASIQNPPAI